jgi:hypothetical protein
LRLWRATNQQGRECIMAVARKRLKVIYAVMRDVRPYVA